MDDNVKKLRAFFRVFYIGIIVFMGLSICFGVWSYFLRVNVATQYVIEFQTNFLDLVENDYEVELTESNNPFNFGHFRPLDRGLIDDLLIVNTDNEAYFINSEEKKYQYGGIEHNSSLLLDDLVLRDKIITSRRLNNGVELIAITTKALVRDRAYKDLGIERQIEFSLLVLVPLIAMVLMWLLEDNFIRTVREKIEEHRVLLMRHQREVEALYSGLFRHNLCVMLLVDPISGEIIDANESAKKYYGYDFKTEKKCVFDINTLEPEKLKHEMKLATESQRSHFLFNHRLKNGSIRNVEVYSGPVEMAGKTVLCSIIHDISDQVQLELSMSKQTEEIHRKLQEKTDIITLLSHEIKTPISGIKMLLRDLGKWIVGLEGERRFNLLKLNIDNLNRLVFDLLDYSSIEIGKFRTYKVKFDVLEVLNDSVQLFKPLASEKRINLILDVSQLSNNLFIGDSFRISQIVNNLISNSIKFTERGMVRVIATDKVVGHATLLTIMVEDTGIGMKPEVISQIFDKYFSSNVGSNITGTGLGLGICRTLIEALDGVLEVESKEGVGTKMTMILELETFEGRDDVSQVASELKQISEHQVVKILIVDDDPIGSMYLDRALKATAQIECQIERVYSGSDAAKKFKNGCFDAVFIDQNLPDCYGNDLALKLTAMCELEQRQCYTILMSSEKMTIEPPVECFLLKPITEVSVIETIKNIQIHKSRGVANMQMHSYRFVDLSEIENIMGFIGMEDFMVMIDLLIQSASEKLMVIQQPYRDEDKNNILKILHGLKGSISYFRASALVSNIAMLEELIASNQDDAIKTKLIRAFIADLEGFFDELTVLKKMYN